MSDVFLLTGCASGIGRHLTRALSTLGHQVVATDINEAGLIDAAQADRSSARSARACAQAGGPRASSGSRSFV